MLQPSFSLHLHCRDHKLLTATLPLTFFCPFPFGLDTPISRLPSFIPIYIYIYIHIIITRGQQTTYPRRCFYRLIPYIKLPRAIQINKYRFEQIGTFQTLSFGLLLSINNLLPIKIERIYPYEQDTYVCYEDNG